MLITGCGSWHDWCWKGTADADDANLGPWHSQPLVLADADAVGSDTRSSLEGGCCC